MNWEAAGAIGEIVGAVAVVATLIYFSIQLRSMQATVAGDSVSRAQETESTLLQLELQYAALIVKANGGDQLSSEESFKLLKLYRSRWSGHLLEFIGKGRLGLSNQMAARKMARSLSENSSFMNLYAEKQKSPDPNVVEFRRQIDYYLEKGVA